MIAEPRDLNFLFVPWVFFVVTQVLMSCLLGSLQATRALMVAAILLGLVGVFVAVTGMKCMKCMEDDQVKKMRMAVFGGVIFIIAGW